MQRNPHFPYMSQMENHMDRYVQVNAFSSFCERPGERGLTIDNATEGHSLCGPIVTCHALARLATTLLDRQTTVDLLLSPDGSRAEFIRVSADGVGSHQVLADGEGRYFDMESRRPVNRAGHRISLAHAEHNARNHASRHDAIDRRISRKAA